MDFIKVQIEMLKIWKKIKERKLEETELVIGTDENNVYVGINYHCIIKIPSSEYFLNLPKEDSMIKFDRLLAWDPNDEATLTKESIKFDNIGTCRKIRTSEYDVLLCEKWLKLFGKCDYRFVAHGERRPVSVYMGDNLIGVITPVVKRHNKVR